MKTLSSLAVLLFFGSSILAFAQSPQIPVPIEEYDELLPSSITVLARDEPELWNHFVESRSKAASGDAAAQLSVAETLELAGQSVGHVLMENAALLGHVEAQYQLACSIYLPLRKEEQRRAYLWMTKAAAGGSIPAMLDVSSYYHFGHGTGQSDQKAQEYLDRVLEWITTTGENPLLFIQAFNNTFKLPAWWTTLLTSKPETDPFVAAQVVANYMATTDCSRKDPSRSADLVEAMIKIRN